MSKQIALACPDCNKELEDVGNYKLGCPNGCLDDMEQWQWEDLIQDRQELA